MKRLAIVCFAMLVATPLWAVPKNWNGGVGNYTDGTQWTPAGAPTSADDAFINSGTANNGALLIIQTPGGSNGASLSVGGTGTLNNSGAGIVIANGGGTTGTVNLSPGGTITAGTSAAGHWSGIAHGGTANFNMTGGTFNARGNGLGGNVGALSIGALNGSNGTLTQSGGAVNVDAGLTMGRDGGSQAAYSLSNGSLNIGAGIGNITLEVGRNGNANFTVNSGTVNAGLTGGGTQGSIVIANTAASTSVFTQNGGNVTAGDPGQQSWMGVGHAGTGSYNISGGTLNARGVGLANNVGSLSIAAVNGSVGTITQTGGTVTSQSGVTMARDAGSTANYIMSAGNLNILGGGTGNHPLEVGRSGLATFNQSGGTASVTGETWVSVNASSSGSSYSLTGTGVLNTDGIRIGGNGGSNGTFTQNGAATQLNSSRLFVLGQNGGSTGNYNLTSGTLNANTSGADGTGAWIGVSGTGFMTQDGGTFNVSKEMYVAGQPGSNGTYTLNNGDLNVSNFGGNNGQLRVGNGGTGVFNQNGGNVNLDGFLVTGQNGGSNGTYNLSGGTLNANTAALNGNGMWVGVNSTGAFNQSGGIANITNNVHIGGNGVTGTVNLTGGTMNVTGNVTDGGTSTLHIDGGNLNVQGDIAGSVTVDTMTVGNVGSGQYDQGGTQNVTINSALFVANQAGSVGVYNHSGSGTLTGNIRVGERGTGTYNLSGTAFHNHTNGNFHVGVFDNAVGEVNQTGGSVNVNNQILNMGWDQNAVGTYNHSAGTITNANQIILGQQGNSQGFYNLSGTGTVGVNGDFTLGVSGNAQGQLTVADTSALTVGGSLIVGETAQNNVVTQSGGTITANMRVGNNGTGTYNLSGTGVLNQTAPDNLHVGTFGNSVGVVNQTGGTVNMPGTILNMGWDGNSIGTYNQSAGSVNNAGSVELGHAGNAQGFYNLSGTGTIGVNGAFIVGVSASGTLDVSGGTLTTGDLIVAQLGGSTGTVNQTGGVINVTSATGYDVGGAGNATVNHSGGVTNVNGAMNVGTGAGTGVYTLSGTGELDFLDTAPMTQVTTGLPASTLTIGANGTFNFDGGILRNIQGPIPADPNDPRFTVGDGNPADNARFVIGVDGVDPNDANTTRAITSIQTTGGGTPADFLLNTDGTLVIDIFGPGSHGFNGESGSGLVLDPLDPNLDSDLLHVTGNADLDGTLEINLNGFQPAPFAWYDVLLADGTIDADGLTLTGVNLFRVIDNPFGPGQLLQVAAPEPASIVLWALLGVLGFAGYVRCRRKA